MSSTLSTQKRQTFLRRKYCFLPVAIALSPPVGRCEAAIGRPPLCSGIVSLLSFLPVIYSACSCAGAGAGAAGAAGAGAPGAPGIGALGSPANSGDATAG